MSPTSHAQPLLQSLYRKVLRRRFRTRARMEPLPRRMLLSATALTSDALVGQTASSQRDPDVAVDAFGNSTIVWESQHQDGDGWGIYARRFSASGTPLAGEFRINQTTAGDQLQATVAADALGNFAVAWTHNTDIYARLFDADGVPLSNEFAVNEHAAGPQQNPHVAMNAGGAFVITWDGQGPGDSAGVWARRFGADGASQGGTFHVNAGDANGIQQTPSVAINAGGQFIIAWADGASGTSQILAQRFAADGAQAGSPLTIGENPSAVQGAPAASINDGGNFVIAYDQDDGGLSSINVYVRRFDSTGVPRDAGATRLNTFTAGAQHRPDIIMRMDGSYTAVWTSAAQDGDGDGVVAAIFNTDGTVQTSAFLVNSTTAGDQNRARAGWNDGRLAIAWNSSSGSGTDAVYARVFAVPYTLNTAPAIAAPTNQATPLNTPLTFSPAGGNAITISDSDAGGEALAITIIAGNGHVTLAGATGLTFTTGDGIADSSIAFTAKLHDANHALDGLIFTPAAGFSGTAALTIDVNDQGHSGAGGAKSAQQVINIDVANSAPTAAIGDLSVPEDSPPSLLKLSDHASDAEQSASSLNYAVVGNSNPALVHATMLNAASDQLILTYAPDAYGTATITIRITDSAAAFTDVSFNVYVSPVNDAPVISINTGLSVHDTLAAGIADARLRLDDVDNFAQEITITLTAAPAHGALTLDGATLKAGDTFTQADVNAGRIAYAASGDGAASDAFTFTASDGAGGTLGPATFAIQLAATNPGGPVLPPSTAPPLLTQPPALTDDVLPPTLPKHSDDGMGPGRSLEESPSTTTALPPAPTLLQSPTGGEGASAPAPLEAPLIPIAPPPDDEVVIQMPAPTLLSAQPTAPPPPVEQMASVAPSPSPSAPLSATTVEEVTIAAEKVAFVAAPQTQLARELDTLREEVSAETRVIRFVAGSASFLTAGLSVVYFLWTIRGGYLLASLLSTMPAWKLVDPLPILDHFDDPHRRNPRGDDDEDDESLASLAQGHRSMT